MPCNLNHRDLAAAVEQGVTAAGGVPLTFNTIAVSDNQTQATPGMRASLVSRELIADSIELMDIAHDFDALVCIVGCDKTVPAALMALARIDKPAVVVYSGPMRAGHWRGERGDDPGGVGGGRRAPPGQARARASSTTLERSACPGPGTCAGQLHRQHDGAGARVPRARRRRARTMVAADELEQRAAQAADGGRAGRAARGRRPPARADFLERRVAAERDGRDRRQRRLDQRRPAPARDRPRGRRRADAGRPVRARRRRRR